MASKFCKQCKMQVRPAVVYQVNHLVHLLVTLLLCGLWLPMWLLACVMSMLQGECCPVCGKRI